MKRTILAALLIPALAFGQTYPSPTFSSLTLQTPLGAVNGGTGATTSTGTGSTVLSNSPALATPAIASPTITGSLTATGLVTPADHATQAANTILGNGAASTASPTALAVPSCSTSAGALGWASGTGFVCNSAINAATLGGATFASPGAIGGTTPGAVAATSVSVPSGGTTATFAGTNGVQITGGGAQSTTPVGNGFLAYGNFFDNYTTTQASLPEWGFQINMTANTGNGLGTPNSDKVAFFSGVSQVAGAGSAWAANLVAQSGSGVGSNGLIGLEIDYNNSNANNYVTVANPYNAGLLFSGAGSFKSQAAIIISGANDMWQRGIYFDSANSGAIAGSSIEDEGTATQSYLLAGTHTYGVNMQNAAISTAGIALPNNAPISALTSGAVLQPILNMSAANNVVLGYTGGAEVMAGITEPITSNTFTLGSSTNLWSSVYGKNYVGTTTNDNANAGAIGEYQPATTSGTSLSSTIPNNCASESLTAGDWDVSGTVQFTNIGSVTSLTLIDAGISTTSATLGAVGLWNGSSTSFAIAQQIMSTPVVRESLATTTTVYLTCEAGYAGTGLTGTGVIRARRIR